MRAERAGGPVVGAGAQDASCSGTRTTYLRAEDKHAWGILLREKAETSHFELTVKKLYTFLEDVQTTGWLIVPRYLSDGASLDTTTVVCPFKGLDHSSRPSSFFSGQSSPASSRKPTEHLAPRLSTARCRREPILGPRWSCWCRSEEMSSPGPIRTQLSSPGWRAVETISRRPGWSESSF